MSGQVRPESSENYLTGHTIGRRVESGAECALAFGDGDDVVGDDVERQHYPCVLPLVYVWSSHQYSLQNLGKELGDSPLSTHRTKPPPKYAMMKVMINTISFIRLLYINLTILAI
mgnify:FL=1